MNRVISKMPWTIEKSDSMIAFETTGGGNWEVWDRYISIDGRKAYHIGNVCGTCSFFFERLDGANRSVSPTEVVGELNQGLKGLNRDFMSKVSKIMPSGNYIAALLRINPADVTIGAENDYFSNEQIDLWEIDEFWGFPHHPKIQYYRGESLRLSDHEMFFEFIVPMFPQRWLDQDVVKEYIDVIEKGILPTAISLSILDIKEPADYEESSDITSHWCLTHYLIDGHHKINAATLAQKPITLLSFIAIDKGISQLENINDLLKKL